MSDKKRPLGDFSGKNTTYGEISTSLNGNPVSGQDSTSNLQPSSLFSNNPINPQAPGTFTNKDKTIRAVRFGGEILNKKEHALTVEQKELAAKKEKLGSIISNLFSQHSHIFNRLEHPVLKDLRAEFGSDEIKSQSDSSIEDIKDLESKLATAQSLEDIKDLEASYSRIRANLQIIQYTLDEAVQDKYKQVAILEELAPLKVRFTILRNRANEIYKKVDQETATKILDLVSSLEWLVGNQAQKKDTTIEDISEGLFAIEEAVEKQESLLKEKEGDNLTKQQEVLLILKELLPLAENYSALKKEAGALALSNIDDITKESLKNKESELVTLKKQLEDNPTKESLESFKTLLGEYTTAIEEGVSLKKEPTDPRGIWSGWPESRFVSIAANPKLGITPHLVFVKENGEPKPINVQESTFWNAIKTNFDTIFKEYEAFLKKDSTTKKIKELSDLIASKNAAIEGILSEDIGEAASLIEVFRIKLAEAKDGWDAKIKKEGEDNIIKQEKAEAKKKLIGEFNELEKKYEILKPLYEIVNSEILSEEERKLITKYQTVLTQEKNTLTSKFTSADQDVTPALLENFELGINEFGKELLKIKGRLDDILPKLINQKIAPPLRTRFGSTNKNNKIILRDGRQITVEEWGKEQAVKYPHQNQTGEQTEEQKLEAFNKTLMQHKEMYGRNPKEYLELYSHKNWVAGDINKKASEELLTSQLASLTQAEESLNGELGVLSAKLATSSEEEKVSIASQLEKLKQKLQLTKEEISSINNISYNQKIAFYKNEGAAKTLRRMKEVYSPAQDSSFTTTSSKPVMKGPFKTIRLASAAKKEATNEGYISEEEASLQNEQLEIYRGYIAEIKAINEKIREDKREGRLENVESDLLKIEEIENKINLLIKKDTPAVSMIEQKSANHYSGMVKGLDQEEAALRPAAYPVPEQAAANPEKTIHRDTNSPEQIQKKRTMVGTLVETRTKNNDKKYTVDWRFWAIATGIVAGGALSTLIPPKNEGQVKAPQTLEQMISWRDTIQEENLKKFTADFLDKKIGFEEIIKKYASSAQLNTNNPESLKRLAVVEPYELLNNNTQEHIFGLSLEERKDLSQISLYLQTLVQATEAKNRMRPNFKQNDYSIAPPRVKLEEYFTIVLGIVTKVDEEERRLKK